MHNEVKKMKAIHQVILVFVLLISVRLDPLYADHQPDSVSAILQSYANAFTTIKPKEQAYVTTPIFLNIEVKNPSLLYNFTTSKPREQEHLASYVQVQEEVEPKSEYDYSSSSLENSNEDEDPKGPPDHVIPFSEHENPREPQTRPNYTAPGEWAKPPSDKNIVLEFVPTKLYAQVRGTHTIKHLPQEDAIKSAETDEEKANAARLKEVVKESKANTVYTEEGYEDAAYDHAGQIRDANFHEGFARKLNDELNRNHGRKRKKTKNSNKRKKKSRKNKSRNIDDIDDFSDDYRDHAEVSEEARISTQQVKPENVKLLREALNKSVINPKSVAEDGIIQLEKDLKEEDLEAQKVSTESHILKTTTPKYSTVTESVLQNKDLETTTMRRDVFTVRPRKPFMTNRPKQYSARIQRPPRYHSITNKNIQNRDFTTNFYDEQPTTVDYGTNVWQYLRSNNATPRVTYRQPYIQPQTVDPVIANPLAVATVNGHGPYLVVVTPTPQFQTPSPLFTENYVSETTVRYITMPSENVTTPNRMHSHNDYSPSYSIIRREEDDIEKYNRYPTYKNPRKILITEKKIKSKSSKTPKLTMIPSSHKIMNYVKSTGKVNYMDYYTVMQPPTVANDLITYPDYTHELQNSALDQWSVKPQYQVENVYEDMENLPEQEAEKTALPQTRLLPPSPLSISEYMSFQSRNKVDKSMLPITAIVPIIEAIHRKKNERNYFPFLFRKKRSATLDYSQPQDVRPRLRRDQVPGYNMTKNRYRSSFRKYPPHFNYLLNEPAKVANKIVDHEIKNRFNLSSGESSNEFANKSFGVSSKENYNELSKENSSNEANSNEKTSVEVEVPEIDFGSVYEEDEVEPTTRRPNLNTKKYPFYRDNKIASNTALKYIINPMQVPQKTLGGMEFYKSRKMECEEVDPNLSKVIPEEEELAEKRGARKSKPRLQGLGDKLDCYKAKYFDSNPFDNPLFLEKRVGVPLPPRELNPKKFATRILHLPSEKTEYVIPRGPKNPEFNPAKRLKNTSRKYITEQSVNHRNIPRSKRPIMNHMHRPKNRIPQGHMTVENKMKVNRTRGRPHSKRSKVRVLPAYQRQVYEDVMGTIMNLEKMHTSHIPKRSAIPVYSKHPNRNREINVSKKKRPENIADLLPPPQYSFSVDNYRNNKRFKRESSNEMFKKLPHIPRRRTRTTNRTFHNNDEKPMVPFRIILTTPPPKILVTEQSTVLPSTDQLTTPKTEGSVYARRKDTSDNDNNLKRFNKFSDSDNISSFDMRRKEPRYSDSNSRSSIKNTSDVAKTNLARYEQPRVQIKIPSVSSSTLVPVAVRPDDDFIPPIPQESQRKYNKQTFQQADRRDDYENDASTTDENPTSNIDEDAASEVDEDPKKQFVVFANMTKIGGIHNNNGAVKDSEVGPKGDEHQEFYDFMEGDPPGYAKAFADENDSQQETSRSRESLENEETRRSDDVDEGNDDDASNEKDSRELSVNKDASVPEDESTENPPSDTHSEDSPKTTHQEPDDEPFTRFSGRPYSPPESYEDEKYSDLGPRVNKPYFYHPPFDVPEYERHNLGKKIDEADDDHEKHEELAFPWEHDDDEVDEGESQHHTSPGKYEYPWEKRERKKKEKIESEEKYGKNYQDSQEVDDGSEASNKEPVYTPLKTGYHRGKKDVTNEEVSTENRPVSRFSSKYNSGTVKIPLKDDEMLITVANSDEIKKTIRSYMNSVKPPKLRLKDSGTSRNITNEDKTDDTSDDPSDSASDSSESNEKLISTTVRSFSSLTTTNPERINRTTTVSPLLHTTSKNIVRGRSRRMRTNENKNVEVTSQTSQISPTPTTINIRRRGRNNISTTTSNPPTQSNIRRRTRPISSTASPVTSSTIPGTNPQRRRRRPFTIAGNSSTTLATPVSTGRNIEHHSKVSKEIIMTETISDDDDDDDEENGKKDDKIPAASGNSPVRYRKIRRRGKPKNDTNEEDTKKKERVEKVTITMEETPEHVFKTKEVDKDGIRGKFITITANNNSATTVRSSGDEVPVNDPEMEEMRRKMDAITSFDSVVRDTEDLADEQSGIYEAQKYLVGSLLQKSPVPSSQRSRADQKKIYNEDSDEEDDEEDDEDDEDDDDYDDTDSEEDDEEKVADNQSSNKDIKENHHTNSNKNHTGEDQKRNLTENQVTGKSVGIIKNPNDRQYFYVEKL